MQPESSEPVFAVLSTLSPDRVGVVAAVTRFLAERHANVEAGHATRLAGFYGGQFLVSAAPADLERITREYRDALRDFSPALCPATGAPVEPRGAHDEAGTPCTVTVLAYDHPGIIAEAAGVLAQLGVSILTLSADKYRAAETGLPLFLAEMQVQVPQGGDLKALAAALAELERRHGWEIDLNPQPARGPAHLPPGPATRSRPHS
jgi:glycine cleavage system transcriptional repressor